MMTMTYGPDPEDDVPDDCTDDVQDDYVDEGERAKDAIAKWNEGR